MQIVTEKKRKKKRKKEKEFEEVFKARGYKLVSYNSKDDPINSLASRGGYPTIKKTCVTVYCPKHNKSQTVLLDNFNQTVHGLRCCFQEFQSKIRVSNQLSKEDLMKRFLSSVENRNHIFKGFEGGIFKTAKTTQACIYCPRHHKEQLIKVDNYERSKYGVRCCRVNAFFS